MWELLRIHSKPWFPPRCKSKFHLSLNITVTVHREESNMLGILHLPFSLKNMDIVSSQSRWGLHSPEKIVRRGRVPWLCLGGGWILGVPVPLLRAPQDKKNTKKTYWQRERSPDFTSSSASQASESLLPGSVEVWMIPVKVLHKLITVSE